MDFWSQSFKPYVPFNFLGCSALNLPLHFKETTSDKLNYFLLYSQTENDTFYISLPPFVVYKGKDSLKGKQLQKRSIYMYRTHIF